MTTTGATQLDETHVPLVWAQRKRLDGRCVSRSVELAEEFVEKGPRGGAVAIGVSPPPELLAAGLPVGL
jgi:hypothetical protein